MKKVENLMTMAFVALMSMVVMSCDDEWHEHYYFDMDEALDAYFGRYGDFGTDDGTTADWFDYYYPYASQYDYRDFMNAVMSEIDNSRGLMARYLNGDWEGPLRMYYKNKYGQSVYTDYQVTWHFEHSVGSDIRGRGTEWRYNSDEGESAVNFSWFVNRYGGIEMSYDAGSPVDEPVNMLISYSNLDHLSANRFKGVSVGVNIDEEDEFDLRKCLPQRNKVSAKMAGKTLGGKKLNAVGSQMVERNITIAGKHR